MRLFPFTPIRYIPAGTKFKFVSHTRLAIIETVVLAIVTVGLLLTMGLNYGVDFRGGTLIEIQTKTGPVDIAGLRSTLGSLNIGDVQIQEFGSPSEALIRVGTNESEVSEQEAVSKVRAALGDNVEYRRIETVGAVVSQELIRSAIISLIVATAGMLTFLWMRFEWQFAVSAIVALLHDLALVLCFICITQMEFDLTVVAALLTLIGYAVNDTVVTFDRVRENLRKFKRMPLDELIDLSVNETLSRTFMTAGAVLLTLIALFLFGGEVIRGFTTVMLVGGVVSSYTSMFVAAPFLALIGVKRDWSGLGRSQKPAERGESRAPRSTAGALGPAIEPENEPANLHAFSGADEALAGRELAEAEAAVAAPVRERKSATAAVGTSAAPKRGKSAGAAKSSRGRGGRGKRSR